jgi:hypothetical protein
MKEHINLRDKKLAKRKSNKPVFSIGVTLICLVLYGGVFLLNSLVRSNIQEIEVEKKSIEKSLKTDEMKEAYNFGADLIDLNSLIAGRSLLEQTSNIIKISEKTLPPVFFDDFGVKNEKGVSDYKIVLLSPDYETLSKQINYYKEIEGIENLFLNETTTIEETDAKDYIKGTVTFTLGLDDKKIQEESKNEESSEDNF